MRKFIILLIILTSLQQSYGCELCGCNSGNYFIGLFPQFNRYFFGVRYSFEGYKTVLRSDPSQFSNDLFQTTELMGGARIRDKWQLLVSMPYEFYQSHSDDGYNHNHGVGDLTLIGNYNLLDKKYLNKDTVTVFQELWIGGGIKFPTGEFSVDTSELVSSANVQPGTGSYDFLVNLIYSYQIKRWGLNFNSSYRINENSGDYKFGNRLNLTAFVFRRFHAGNFSLNPNIGLMYQNLKPSLNNKEQVENTGGNVLFTSMGIELRYNSLALGLNAGLPVYSDLSGNQTKAQLRGMGHITYMF